MTGSTNINFQCTPAPRTADIGVGTFKHTINTIMDEAHAKAVFRDNVNMALVTSIQARAVSKIGK